MTHYHQKNQFAFNLLSVDEPPPMCGKSSSIGEGTLAHIIQREAAS